MTIISTARRAALAGALAVAGTSLVALPASVQAAPLTASAAQPPTKAADPIAQQAAQALDRLNRWAETGSDADLDAYQSLRSSIAAIVGERIEVDPSQLDIAWREADVDHQQALMAALSQVGVPYRRNASRPGVGFDCSGLTTYAWGQAGFVLPRQSTSQIRSSAPRTIDTAQAGDIVQYPGHVMMWLGVDRAIVHAIGRGRTVEVDHARSRRSLRFGDPTGD